MKKTCPLELAVAGPSAWMLVTVGVKEKREANLGWATILMHLGRGVLRAQKKEE